MRLLGFNLLCVTDRTAVRDGSLAYVEDTVVDLAQAGLRGVQIREKDLPDSAIRPMIVRLQDRLKGYPIRIFVNSRPALAKEFKLALHLPDGSDVAAARRELGPDAVIGVSCHSPEGAEAAERNGASFVMYGPIFSPISKSDSGKPAGLDALAEVCGDVKLPVVAVGGITPRNAKACMEAGSQAVASVGALLAADAPRESLVDFMRALGRL